MPNHRTCSALKWARWLLFAAGISLLGFVGYSLADARLFQVYESWKLDRELENSNFSAAVQSPGLAAMPAVYTQRHNRVATGTMIGRIEIGSVGMAVIVVEGSDGKALRRGVGHMTGTPMPGEQGNVVLTGHRDTFFRPLLHVRQNDEVTLTTLSGTYRYRVESMKVVSVEDTEVLNSSNEPMLTLVTCYPFYYIGPAPKRFVVRAREL